VQLSNRSISSIHPASTACTQTSLKTFIVIIFAQSRVLCVHNSCPLSIRWLRLPCKDLRPRTFKRKWRTSSREVAGFCSCKDRVCPEQGPESWGWERAGEGGYGRARALRHFSGGRRAPFIKSCRMLGRQFWPHYIEARSKIFTRYIGFGYLRYRSRELS